MSLLFPLRILPLIALAVLSVASPVRLSAADDDSNVFGHITQSEAALIGILYDTKQTMDHQPTNIGIGDGYTAVIDECIFKGWDESVLNKYYRVSRPIFTTQIFIPQMSADNGPKAFGADKFVKPAGWLIHYKGQVSPPADGTYRFWGSGDDILDVGIDSKLVMVGNRFDSPFKLNPWKSPEPDGAAAADGVLHAGLWLDLKADKIYDLDVIIGERPGGLFNAFLMIEKKGETYEKDKDGHPILPIFQVAPYDTPVHPANFGDEPLFSKGPSWKSYQ